MKIANDRADKVERAIPIAIQETMQHLVPAEKIIAERIGMKITHIVQRGRLLPSGESNERM